MTRTLLIQALGVAWYQEKDYPRILQIMDDADVLPGTYRQWLDKAVAVERQAKRSGQVVIVRAPIDPDEFTRWCAINGMSPNAKARMSYAAEFAKKHAEN